MQGWDICALEEPTDGNLVAPKQRSFHRRDPIVRIIGGVILELLHAGPEPRVGVVVVISHAGTEYVEERKALVLDTLFDQFGEMLLFAAESASHKGRPTGQGQRDGMQRSFDTSEGHALGLHTEPAGGRGLAGGQSVDL